MEVHFLVVVLVICGSPLHVHVENKVVGWE
jgi:hypothetical protein